MYVVKFVVTIKSLVFVVSNAISMDCYKKTEKGSPFGTLSYVFFAATSNARRRCRRRYT